MFTIPVDVAGIVRGAFDVSFASVEHRVAMFRRKEEGDDVFDNLISTPQRDIYHRVHDAPCPCSSG